MAGGAFPTGKLERDRVADVHGAAGGSAAGVEEEGLAALVDVEDGLEVAVGEEEATSEPAVWLVAC